MLISNQSWTGSKRTLIIILTISVLLRVGYALYLGTEVVAPPLLSDQLSYHTLATRVLDGHGFSFPVPWYPNALPDKPTSFWSFGYVLYLAVIYALFGPQPLAARLIGAVLGGILLPYMVYRLAQCLFATEDGSERIQSKGDYLSVACTAVLLTAIYAYFILYAATLMTETFYIVGLLWSLERALALAKDPTIAQGAILGLALGIAALFRQSILPWAVMMFVWLLWVGYYQQCLHHVIVSLLVSTAVMLLLILPFTIRNYRAYGSFLLLNSNTGYAMYSAQHPMHDTSFQEFAAAPIPQELLGLNEAQLDRELMRRGIGFVQANPGRYLLLSLSRVRDYFEFWPTPDTTLLHNVGRVGSFGLFLPFMLYGFWLAVRRAGLRLEPSAWVRFSVTPLALVFSFMLFYSLLHILTWAMPRYRLPVDAVALPFAALALADLTARIPWPGARWGAGTIDNHLGEV